MMGPGVACCGVGILLSSLLTILVVCIGIAVAVFLCWKRHAYMTMSLGILNIVVFVVHVAFYHKALLQVSPMSVFTFEEATTIVNQYRELSVMWYETGFRPIILAGEQPQYAYTLLTSMFVHNGLLHIIGNSIFLVLFGVPFEERVGWKRVALIYFGAGILGAVVKGGMDILLAGYWDFNPTIPNIGASVAIAGIMGAFLFLYPKDKVLAPIGFFIMRAPVYLAVMIFIGYESFVAFSNPNDNISHFGHIFGIIMGFILAPIAVRLIKHTGSRTTRHREELATGSLKDLVTTDELARIYGRIEGEDEPAVRDAWVEKLVENAACPSCKGRTLAVDVRKGKLRCEQCEYALEL